MRRGAAGKPRAGSQPFPQPHAGNLRADSGTDLLFLYYDTAQSRPPRSLPKQPAQGEQPPPLHLPGARGANRASILSGARGASAARHPRQRQPSRLLRVPTAALGAADPPRRRPRASSPAAPAAARSAPCRGSRRQPHFRSGPAVPSALRLPPPEVGERREAGARRRQLRSRCPGGGEGEGGSCQGAYRAVERDPSPNGQIIPPPPASRHEVLSSLSLSILFFESRSAPLPAPYLLQQAEMPQGQAPEWDRDDVRERCGVGMARVAVQ